MTSHRRLRAGLIGAALMTSGVAVAIYVVPAAEAPDEPSREEVCIQTERPEPIDVAETCGGSPIPFLTHEHRETSGVVTRFEVFPRGEWRLSKLASGDTVNGCTGSMTLGELRALATAAPWKRQAHSSACDVTPSGAEAWLVDGVEQLVYNVCDLEQPDPQTEAAIERMLAVEASDTPGAVQHGDCPKTAFACYEWLGGSPAGTRPESKFVVEDTGAWELTQRDVQSDAITLHKRGVLPTSEVDALRDRITHASWKLVGQRTCSSDTRSVGTVAARGHSVTYGPCSSFQPDRSTQTAIDQLFAIYRSALRSNPHI
jgi:hypothetical protein